MPKNITFPIHEAPASKPAKSCDVLIFCVAPDGLIYHGSVVRYSLKHDAFNCGDQSSDEEAEKRREVFSDVKYWAYLDEVVDAIVLSYDNTFSESQAKNP